VIDSAFIKTKTTKIRKKEKQIKSALVDKKGFHLFYFVARSLLYKIEVKNDNFKDKHPNILQQCPQTTLMMIFLRIFSGHCCRFVS